MPACHTLDTIQIPAALVWEDEFDWTPVETASEYGVTGALIVDVAERLAGRPITLAPPAGDVWVSRAVVQQLAALAAAPGATYTLALADGRSFTVMFRPGETKPVEASQVQVVEDPGADHNYVVTLRLTEV